jgi:hypothetical protein
MLLRPATLLTLLCIAAPCCAAPDLGGVSVGDFEQFALAKGTELEDWQPAFQKALEACSAKGGKLLIPCGTYKIRKAIQVPETEVKKGFMNPGRLTIQGAGRMQSIIWQQVQEENAVDWTGPSQAERFAGGVMKDVGIMGGKICLNIRWHNQVHLDNCYIAGAQQFGIHAEGFSSRFSNLIIRSCKEAGLRGTAHFNDIVVRDSYFSRNKIGISLAGGSGVRVVGVGFEHCADSAIAVMNASSVSIRDCYFESNGVAQSETLGRSGPTFPNVVHLDALANNVVITGCIFRGGRGYGSAYQVGIIGGVNHTIRENRFTNCQVAIRLLAESTHAPKTGGWLPHRLRLMQNDFHMTEKVAKLLSRASSAEGARFLAEATPGLIARAKAAGCELEPPTVSRQGSDD